MNFKILLHNAAHAFRQNIIPGAILQLIAVSLGLAYFFLPSLKPAFNFFGGLKDHYGIWYAILATSLFGGVIPYCYLYAQGQILKNPGKQFLFYAGFWAIIGAVVDLFYRFQGYIFSTGNDWQTVIAKTFVDQFFFAPVLMVPTISLAYLWKESDFNLIKCRRRLDRGFFLTTVPTIVLSNLLVWLPAIVVIYLMPSNLQVPLYNLVQCFFVLLLAILAKNPDE